MMGKKKKAASAKDGVSFRWETGDVESPELLQKEAERTKLTPGQAAREIVKKGLRGEGTDSLRKIERMARRQIKLLEAINENIGNSVKMLLAHAGALEEQDAEDWVNARLTKTS